MDPSGCSDKGLKLRHFSADIIFKKQGGQMRYYLFLFLSVFSLNAFCADVATQDDRDAACTNAIASVRTTLENDIARHRATLASNPHAVDAASNQPFTTGNPLTDAYANLNRAQSDLAQTQQQKIQAQSQVENECFQQFEDISDKCHDTRQKEYDRLRQVNMAEGEKMKQESEIRLSCWKEASTLFQAEMGRLAEYVNRTVGSINGATRSKKDIEGLRTNFYNQCFNSPATQEAIRSCKADFDVKMRNFSLMATELASDLEYHENTKMARMNAHCKLRQEQIDAQFAPMRNQAIQNIAMGGVAMLMASYTASASADGQQQVRDTYNSLNIILNNWARITQNCTGLNTATISNPDIDSVPSDAYSVMQPIHDACRPANMPASIQCFKNSGSPSTELQNANRATSSQQ
jgi:hypothetical protein